MTDLTVSADLLRPTAAAPTAANRDKIQETAKAFEATFISQMLKPMFEGLSTDGLFGGGQGDFVADIQQFGMGGIGGGIAARGGQC